LYSGIISAVVDDEHVGQDRIAIIHLSPAEMEGLDVDFSRYTFGRCGLVFSKNSTGAQNAPYNLEQGELELVPGEPNSQIPLQPALLQSESKPQPVPVTHLPSKRNEISGKVKNAASEPSRSLR
jgi:hypothetical protein